MKSTTPPKTYPIVLSLCCAILLTCPTLRAQSGSVPTARAARTSAYSTLWTQDASQPDLAAFRAWADRYVASTGSVERSQLLSEGQTLARQRHAAFARLIKEDPAQALALSVPASVRQKLPAEITGELETRVSGIGDLSVLGAISTSGGPQVQPVQRFVRLNGQTYPATVYGRRAGQTTKHGVPLHGVIVDGVLALHESALRELDADESPSGTAPAADVGGQVIQFTSRDQMNQAEARLEAAEAGINPQPVLPAAAVLASTAASPAADLAAIAQDATTAWTTGIKKVLVLRVDFDDLPGIPTGWNNSAPITSTTSYTPAYLTTSVIPQIVNYYQQSSYGQTSLAFTVAPKVYRMPTPAATYAAAGANVQLHDDAVNAAASDFNAGSFDKIVVVFSYLGHLPGSLITYGGLSDIGGPRVWYNGEFDFRVGAHELGHTYGLFHAGLWQVNDGNPISPNGSITPYGDDFDTMGDNFANSPSTDFNPYAKNQLGWIPDTHVLTVRTNGTYRIFAFDTANHAAAPANLLALRLPNSNTNGPDYWVGIRRNFTANTSMQNGAYVFWGYPSPVPPNSGNADFSALLDLNTPGDSDQDAALALGTSFSDPGNLISIMPVAKGGTPPNYYLDVQVSVTLSPPVITAPLPGHYVSNSLFTATGTVAHNDFVANVFYSLNNGDWSPAQSPDAWADWTADLMPAPGTNTLSVYCTDGNGHNSATNSVKFVYIVSAPLTVQINGRGTLTPDYDGRLLEIGRNYTMTATPALGFAFTNWSGGTDTNQPFTVLTNKPALTFMMEPNLNLLATFVDVQRPTIVISKPTFNQRITNNLFTASGTAADNGSVQAVQYSLNGSDWQPATGTTNWSVDLTLVPGTNMLRVFSVDAYNNTSLTSSVSLFSVVPTVVTVQTNGRGTITPNYNGQLLEIGRNYTMTATPGLGFILTNWSSNLGFPGGTLTNKPALTFMMESNLSLVATFVDAQRPTVVISKPTLNQRITNNLFTASGTAADNGSVQAVQYSLNGSDWQTATGTTNWSADLALAPGTNVLRAFSVDAYNNHSLTSSVSLFSVVPALITVQTNGRGILTPNYNSQLLEIGRNYTMTATPGLGFALTNWSSNLGFPAGTLTNKPALTFLMASNLSLLATFVDVQRPTLLIAKPTLNQRITNDVSTASGTAADNGSVQAVQYSLNGADWLAAVGTTNWSVDLTLVPGTNVLRAFSVDAYNNHSLTSSVSLFYVVPALITVQTNGRGTLTPNYNGQLLEIGRDYTMTALPGLGFALTNWSGGTDTNQPLVVLTNKPALTFLMASNLSLLATFVDVQRPTVLIAKPTLNQRITNDVFTASGTALDNDHVQTVQYSLNGADWLSASGTTNWSVDLNLVPGTNVLRAFSVDAYNNSSLTSSVSLFSVVPSQITVLTNGLGTIAPNYNGQFLEIGRLYSMTATPGLGCVFSNWTGGLTSRTAALSFLMQSNLVLQANFITNPFTHAAGIYNGLFYDTNGVTHQSSGYFTATPTAQGAYSGNFSLAGVTYPFLGQFYVDGTASNSIARSGTNALTLLLDWDLAGGKVMTGTLSDGTWTAELAANRATWNALTNPAPAGRYTLLLPGGADSLAQPGGDGSGALTISTAGQIVFSGKLGDGTAVLQSTTLSDDGQWPFYLSLYAGKGSMLGWLSLSNQPASDLSGAVSWIKLPQVATYYPTGFVFESQATGSLYVPPAFGVRALNFDLGQLWVTNGNLLAGFTNQVRLTPNNLVQNLGTNTLSLTLSPTLGTFTGYTIDPLTQRVLILNGALLQKQNFGGGSFLGTNQSGRVYFGP